jgi:hypothetical protein
VHTRSWNYTCHCRQHGVSWWLHLTKTRSCSNRFDLLSHFSCLFSFQFLVQIHRQANTCISPWISRTNLLSSGHKKTRYYEYFLSSCISFRQETLAELSHIVWRMIWSSRPGFDSWQGKDFCLCLQRWDRLWGPPSLLSNGHRMLFPRG